MNSEKDKFNQVMGAWLKEVRESLSLSQHQVYKDTGIHVGRIESGKTSVRFKTLQTLCDHYEISIAELIESAGQLTVRKA